MGAPLWSPSGLLNLETVFPVEPQICMGTPLWSPSGLLNLESAGGHYANLSNL
jgi:hypothetical protein